MLMESGSDGGWGDSFTYTSTGKLINLNIVWNSLNNQFVELGS